MAVTSQKSMSNLYRNSVPLRFDLGNIWTCPWADIAAYPITPTSSRNEGSPSLVADNKWLCPPSWFAPNVRNTYKRLIDFSKLAPAGWRQEDIESLRRRVKRLLLLDWNATIRAGVRGTVSSPPDALTWANRGRMLIAAAHYAASNYTADPQMTNKTTASRCPDGVAIFRLLSVSDFDDVIARHHHWARMSAARFNAMCAAGLMDDWPARDVRIVRPSKKVDSIADKPFSDAAFAEIVRAAFWVSALTEDALAAYERFRAIEATPGGSRRRVTVIEYRTTAVRDWTPANIRPNQVLPYVLRLYGLNFRSFPFGSGDFRSLIDLLTLCQTANAIIVFSSTGMRIGELTGLPPDALRKDGSRYYIDGGAYKSTDVPEGQLRSWPLPDIAVVAFERQYKIFSTLGGSRYMWLPRTGSQNTTGVPKLSSLIENFGNAVMSADLRKLSEIDGKLSSHRFRYTVSRLAALALEGATQIMFDVLGHSDKDVTLGYIFRDPELREDIAKVRREVRAVRAKEVFDHADKHGGQGAALVRRIKSDMLARSGRSELDTEDLLEGAQILGACDIVRPGVLCTAQHLERGLCSSSIGIRDFAACSTRCMHRLELSTKRSDRQNNIHYILGIIAGKGVLDRAFLQNQLLANFGPFPDLVDDFAQDCRLQAALVDCDHSRWAALPPELRERLAPILSKAT